MTEIISFLPILQSRPGRCYNQRTQIFLKFPLLKSPAIPNNTPSSPPFVVVTLQSLHLLRALSFNVTHAPAPTAIPIVDEDWIKFMDCISGSAVVHISTFTLFSPSQLLLPLWVMLKCCNVLQNNIIAHITIHLLFLYPFSYRWLLFVFMVGILWSTVGLITADFP